MSIEFPLGCELPPPAEGGVRIVRELSAAGYQALLAGGCVRDFLLGREPLDYDVATEAPPERICELFRATRKVGMQFGVVLVRMRRRWIEVATFRADGPYLDGRRPSQVTPTDAKHDAQRRDFTVNGMFLDPLRMQVIDYVGGRADLEARLIRAIGEPAARFAEDHLRLLRAVRFAARLGFPIEPVTLTAIQTHADKLAQVAAERVREELEKMLTHPTRCQAWELLGECGLRPHLWAGAGWDAGQTAAVDDLLAHVNSAAPFELALAIMLLDFGQDEIDRVARALALSNEQRAATKWLVKHSGALDDPHVPTLAELKRLMANRSFAALRMLAAARHRLHPRGDEQERVLDERIGAIAPEAVQPTPLVDGQDLLERGVEQGPAYKKLLDMLYTRQLDEELLTREAALEALDTLLRDRV